MKGWFKHEEGLANTESVVFMRSQYGWHGYGIYIALLEQLREAEGYRLRMDRLQVMAFAMQYPELPQYVGNAIASFGLFESDGEWFWSPWLCGIMAEYDAVVAARVEAGKAGAAARWHGDGKRIANALQSHSNGNGNAPKIDATAMQEREEEEDKKKKKTGRKKEREEEENTTVAIAPVGVHKQVQEAFESWYEKETGEKRLPNYGREGKAIKAMLELVRDRGDPFTEIRQKAEVFQKLRKSGDKFWADQPPLPSAMVSLWARIATKAANNEAKAEEDAEMLDIAKLVREVW